MNIAKTTAKVKQAALMILAVALVATGFTTVSFAKPAPQPPLANSSIQWGDCPPFEFTPPSPELECGTVQVPLDYTKPNGEKINIAVSQLKAGRPQARHGVLFLNPGGPGGAGLDMPLWMADLLPQSILDRFDLIGFDPRGVGYSAPLSCGLSELQAYEIAPPFEQPGGFDGTAAFMRQAAEACGQVSGNHLAYMNTPNTVRDMDRIRQALGEATISYYGLSYGTYLGAQYASRFPNQTDRFVLDSATPPTGNWRELFRQWGLAEASRFPDFAQFAAAHNDDYGLGTTPAEVRATFFQLLEQVTQEPVPLPGTAFTLNAAWFRVVTFDGLTSDSSFDDLARIWQLVETGQGTSELLGLADSLSPRTPAQFPNVPEDNFGAATLAILCNDWSWSRSVEQYRQELNADVALYPMFGIIGSHIWPCAFWPNDPIEQPQPISSIGPSNIMIVHNLRDPATPYAGAVDMRNALGQRARLVSVDQGGHGASYGENNDCSKEAVTNYLVTGNLSVSDFSCPAESDTTLSQAEENAIKHLRHRMW